MRQDAQCDIALPILSDRLSVRHVVALYLSEGAYSRTFIDHLAGEPSFRASTPLRNCPGIEPMLQILPHGRKQHVGDLWPLTDEILL